MCVCARIILYFYLYNLTLFIFCFQSLALQDGCQKKTKLERIAPMLESTADSHVHAGSQLGPIPIDRACSLKEHHTYDHDLPCDEEIHAKGSLPFTNKSPRSSAKKQCLFPSFHAESSCSSAGSLNYFFSRILIVLLAR